MTPNRLKVIALAVSVSGIAGGLTRHFEGTVYKAYLDPVGIPTICTGHTAGVRLGQVATQKQCDEFLEQDLNIARAAVDRLVKVEVSHSLREALASFVFSVGQGNFAKSTLLKRLNGGDTKGACAMLEDWVYAKGIKLNGLAVRREAERYYCEL